MKLFILFTTLLSFLGIVASATINRSTLEKRQTAIFRTSVGLGTAIEQDLLGFANAVATGGDPTTWINDMVNQYQTVISALLELKPNATAPQEDDIVDVSVKIIVDTVVTMTEKPLSLAVILLEPALDNAISQWLLATNGVIPGIVNKISSQIAPSNYVHLLNLNLVLSLDALGLGNLLGKIL